MYMRFRVLAVFGLLAATVPCLASSNSGISYDSNGFNPRMLDASAPQAERMQLFAHVVQLGVHGEVPALDLAGTMYWQGANIQGSPVKTDLAQARKLLAYAAVHGDVLAMAKLGELNLAAKQPQKAMIWAQLYAHYLDPTRHARGFHGRMYAYASDLMQRTMHAGGKVDDSVRTDVGNMIAKYDSSIRAGIDAFMEQRRSGKTHLVVHYMGHFNGEKVNQNDVADYMVAFNPDGSIKKVWTLASWPNTHFAATTRTWLDHARANPAPASSGTRYLEIPIVYNSYKTRSLRVSHSN
ncbi:MAG TPA: hypothetical protein VF269_07615 [Rhodanobacteraceae bacterium]